MKFFEKIAFRYNKAGHIKDFRIFNSEEMLQAISRQGPVMGIYGLAKKLGGTPALRQSIRGAKKKLSSLQPLGTIYKTPKGKKIAVDKKYWDKLNHKEKRNVYYHEMFHAKNKVFGQSELAAHLYGGIKSGVGGKKMVKHFIKGRPVRAAIEFGAVGAVPVIGAKTLKSKESTLKKGE